MPGVIDIESIRKCWTETTHMYTNVSSIPVKDNGMDRTASVLGCCIHLASATDTPGSQAYSYPTTPPPFVPAHKRLGPLSPRMLSSCSPQQSACWLQPRGQLLRLAPIPAMLAFAWEHGPSRELALSKAVAQDAHAMCFIHSYIPMSGTGWHRSTFSRGPGFIYGLDLMTL